MLIRSLLAALMVLPALTVCAQDAQTSYFVSELPSTYHSGWARLSQDGYFRSRVIGHDGVAQVGANVTIRQAGEVVATAKTDANGTFETSGLHTGVYEVRVDGQSGCAVTAMRVMPAKGNADSITEIYSSSLSSAWYDKMAANLTVPAELSGAPVESLGGQAIPTRQSRRVLIENGQIRGQIAFASGASRAQDLIAFLYRDGQEVAQALVDQSGEFFLPVEAEGYYDVFVGGSANCLMGIEAIDSNYAAKSSRSFKYVSLNQSNAATSLCCPVATPSYSSGPVGGTVSPVAGGGFAGNQGFVGGGLGGGGFGGGAGGGGGGGIGIGGLAGIAGLAVGIPALADDDSANNVATPIAP